MPAPKKKVHHLSVFLLKERVQAVGEAIRIDACDPPIAIPLGAGHTGQLYVKRTEPESPKWTALFVPHLDPLQLKVPGVSGALFVATEGRCFVLAFGQGGRFLLQDDVFEERFGLLSALNLIDPGTFRSVDVQSLNAIESHSRIQTGQATTSDQFGLNVEEDLLKAVVGTPRNEALGARMAGADALSVSVAMALPDLPALLSAYREAFEADLTAGEHQWVQNIAMLKGTGIIDEVEALLDAKLAAGELQGVWLSVPDIIDWTVVTGFVFTNGRGVMHTDVTMAAYRTALRDEPLSVEAMRRHTVYCVDANHQHVHRRWKVFRCLYAEVSHEGTTYVLNDGRWFAVAADFVARTLADFDAIPYNARRLPNYTGGGEGLYNAEIARAEPLIYDLLDDKKKVMHGGGQGQVEICDLFTSDRELIHVKIYGKSSVLSHLFAQGFVSGQLIQIDSTFRQKVRQKLSPSHRSLIPAATKPAHETLTIVYAVISDGGGEALHLPFFSKVNLNNTRKILRGFGYKVELLKIRVAEEFARLSRIPPKKGRRVQGN